eukprot:TRINITY_DN65615_c0_g1_i4.p1 TRINITY_DN65615_c0_g1~~TRINITY_DN65615_c0_g1_i4.p1  ORF type:complete len:187 (-),score=18.99 TRINITY_DN65615_c0_g1_i4:194-754(-)
MQVVDTRLSGKSCGCECRDVVRMHVLRNLASSALSRSPSPIRLRHGVLRATPSLHVLLHASRPQHLPGRLLLPLHECLRLCCLLCRSCSSNGRLFLSVSSVQSVRWLYYRHNGQGVVLRSLDLVVVCVHSATPRLDVGRHHIIFALFNLHLLGDLHIVFNLLKIAFRMARSRRAHRRHAAAAQVLH